VKRKKKTKVAASMGEPYDAGSRELFVREERPDGVCWRFVGGRRTRSGDDSSGGDGNSPAPGRVHFVGIGGSALSNLALLALEKGFRVSGSDIRDSGKLEDLRRRGAVISVGHKKGNVLSSSSAASSLPVGSLPDAVVISSAIPADNPEVLAALSPHIPLYKRGTWLGRVTKGYDTVSVAGTHGKTTTSAMLALCLQEHFQSITAIVGGDVSQFNKNEEEEQQDKQQTGTGSLIGSSKWFVLEADEYDRAFLHLQSNKYCIVTNAELDHLDIYESEEDLLGAFEEFLENVLPQGAAVLCGDDPGCKNLLRGKQNNSGTTTTTVLPAAAAMYTYGLEEENDWRATRLQRSGLGTCFDVQWMGKPVGKVNLPLLGTHNVLNALAVISLTCVIHLKEKQQDEEATGATLNQQEGEEVEPLTLAEVKECVRRCGEVLSQFGGVDRRCQILGEKGKCTVISDYAHHPTEVEATLEAIGDPYEGSEVIVVFEPHTLSRLAYFFSEFVSALSSCKLVYISEVFEPVKTYINKKVKDAIAEDLAAALPLSTNATFVNESEVLLQNVLDKAKEEGDKETVVLVLGAGKADGIAKTVFNSL
jgi:UDP-N-acetylmuramate--L-alanine ligase